MKTIRQVLREVIRRSVLPWIERDGVSKLIPADQINPADRAQPIECKPPVIIVHRAHELAVGLSGRAPYCIDGKRFVFTPGRILLLPTGTPHGAIQTVIRKTEDIDFDQPSSVLWLLAYPFGVLVQICQITDDTYATTPSVIFPEPHISGLAGRLLEEMRSGLPNYKCICRCILMEFMEQCIRATTAPIDAGFTMALRRLPKRGLTRFTKGRSNSSKLRRRPAGNATGQLPGPVQTAREFIHSHYNGPVRLDDIAEAADSSADHLGRLFKAATGKTPMQYLLDVRMEAAKELLLTNLKVSNVSYLVGIEDPCYFSRAFRRIHGLSPLEYRRKMAKATKRSKSQRNPTIKHKTR